MELTRTFSQLINKIHKLLFLLVKNISEKYIHSELIIDNMSSYEGPAIYAVNHTNVSDIPVVFHTLNKQTYVLCGTKSQKFIDSIGFNLNGVIWVDRHSVKSKKDRQIKYTGYYNPEVASCGFRKVRGI